MKLVTMLVGVAGVAAGAMAGGGTLVDGDASLQLIGPTVFQSNLGDANMTTAPGTVDQLYKFTWYYRTANNNQNSYFSKIDTPSEVYAGNHATISYRNAGPGVAGFERFDADISVTLADGDAPGRAGVVSSLVFKNVSNQANTFQLFSLVDMDIGGVNNAANNIVELVDPAAIRARISDKNSDNYGEVYGSSPSRFEIGSGSTLRSKLTGGSFDLDNDPTIDSGDVAVGYQWSVTLAPGESVTLWTGFAFNQTAVPAPGSVVLAGIVGLTGSRRRR
jgi:hypothetical protein